MDALTYTELMTGLVSVLGTAVLFLLVANRAPKALQDEIALRVERSILAIDTCKNTPLR